MYRSLLVRSTRSATCRSALSMRWNTTASSSAPSLRAKLQSSLKEAMKARDGAKATVIRSVMAEILNADKASKSGEPVGPAEVVRALQQGIARREDAIKQYQAGSREDLVSQSQAEILILQSFVPPQLSEAEVDSRIAAVLEQMRAAGEKVGMGGVMKKFWEGTDKADVAAAVVSARVKAALEGAKP
ncbi:GatB/YqeY domain-containing protein [Calocera viscosa TUFC12733]|uniref:Altered inheritance of mitochondria protein 41 n=1 Tax=Calocera viscosa (strain TUFC12733) TaxID=1330018 RepID=A0A167JB38_CALVF|nr:GatB/YqeY domain-containing protein [Calocera viscosa TUFC12733]